MFASSRDAGALAAAEAELCAALAAFSAAVPRSRAVTSLAETPLAQLTAALQQLQLADTSARQLRTVRAAHLSSSKEGKDASWARHPVSGDWVQWHPLDHVMVRAGAWLQPLDNSSSELQDLQAVLSSFQRREAPAAAVSGDASAEQADSMADALQLQLELELEVAATQQQEVSDTVPAADGDATMATQPAPEVAAEAEAQETAEAVTAPAPTATTASSAEAPAASVSNTHKQSVQIAAAFAVAKPDESERFEEVAAQLQSAAADADAATGSRLLWWAAPAACWLGVLTAGLQPPAHLPAAGFAYGRGQYLFTDPLHAVTAASTASTAAAAAAATTAGEGESSTAPVILGAVEVAMGRTYAVCDADALNGIPRGYHSCAVSISRARQPELLPAAAGPPHQSRWRHAYAPVGTKQEHDEEGGEELPAPAIVYGSATAAAAAAADDGVAHSAADIGEC